MATHNISFVRGASFSSTVTIKNADGSAFDLTGYTVSGSLKSRYGYESDFAAFNAQIGAPATEGVLTIGLSPEDTADLPVTQAVYTIEAVKEGVRTIILSGYAAILPD